MGDQRSGGEMYRKVHSGRLVVVQMVDKEASTTENWSFDWHPSKPRGQERVYRFYAHYASMEWFEGRIWIHPLYVCAIAIPSQNEGGKNE